ncbi:MAG: P-loop containing nucleoside triphosphate hydrolase protein [Monoraphidium minutum]|nr:MAG: P-loop containing nucleoside triphosphate hydrolase protein [Monoraphidium minutum]
MDGGDGHPRPTGGVNCRCQPPQLAPFCYKTKKAGPNHGRWFFKCDSCSFFKWADELPGYPNVGWPAGGGGGGTPQRQQPPPQHQQSPQWASPPPTAQRAPGQQWGSPLPFAQPPGPQQQQQQQQQQQYHPSAARQLPFGQQGPQQGAWQQQQRQQQHGQQPPFQGGGGGGPPPYFEGGPQGGGGGGGGGYNSPGGQQQQYGQRQQYGSPGGFGGPGQGRGQQQWGGQGTPGGQQPQQWGGQGTPGGAGPPPYGGQSPFGGSGGGGAHSPSGPRGGAPPHAGGRSPYAGGAPSPGGGGGGILPPGIKARITARRVKDGEISLPYPYDEDFMRAVKALNYRTTARGWRPSPIKSWVVSADGFEEVGGRARLALLAEGYEVVPPAEAPPPEAVRRVQLDAPGECDARRRRHLPDGLWEQLMPFQREGVMYALQRQGRILLADEMGLGKTMQAIAMAACYPEDWPLLVVCPASLRTMWREKLREWLPPRLRPRAGDLRVVTKGADVDALLAAGDPPPRSVCVVGYSLVDHLGDAAAKYGVVICDESHQLKSRGTARTKFVVRAAKRAILITGTPLLSRPIEAWPQVDMLRAGLLGSYDAFGERHCVDPADTAVIAARGAAGGAGRGRGRGGACNLEALRPLLEANVMLRRTKDSIEVEIRDPSAASEVARIRAAMAAVREKLRRGGDADAGGMRLQQLTMELWRATGRGKVPAAIEFISDDILELPPEDEGGVFGGGAAGARAGGGRAAPRRRSSAVAAAAEGSDEEGAAPRRGGGARKRRGAAAVASDDDAPRGAAGRRRKPPASKRARRPGGGSARGGRGAAGDDGYGSRSEEYEDYETEEGEEEEEEEEQAGGGGGKLIVFGHHSEVLDALEARLLVARGVGFIRIDGAVAGRERHALVDRFQDDPSVRVALVSINAGGQGLTLTAADKARPRACARARARVVFVELFWNPASLMQAEDRAHRVGQEKPVKIYYLVAPGSADEEVWRKLTSKLHVTGAALGDDAAHAAALDLPGTPPRARTPPHGAGAAPPPCAGGAGAARQWASPGGSGGGGLGATPAAAAAAATAVRAAAAAAVAAAAAAGVGSDDELDDDTLAAAEEVLSQHEQRLSQPGLQDAARRREQREQRPQASSQADAGSRGASQQAAPRGQGPPSQGHSGSAVGGRGGAAAAGGGGARPLSQGGSQPGALSPPQQQVQGQGQAAQGASQPSQPRRRVLSQESAPPPSFVVDLTQEDSG